MKYIIHSIIIFNTEEYTITSVHNPKNFVKLSNSAGRVLEELIKCHHSNIAVTREHLFSIIWKSYGLKPSNGNLNQQISLIRKILTRFGLNKSSIITIPKKGFKLNDQLAIEKKEKQISNNTLVENSTNHTINMSSPIILNTRGYVKYILITISIMFLIFNVGFIYLYTKQNNIKLYCCKDTDSCDICSFNTVTEFDGNTENVQNYEII